MKEFGAVTRSGMTPANPSKFKTIESDKGNTTAEEVAERLRSMIHSGELASGADGLEAHERALSHVKLVAKRALAQLDAADQSSGIAQERVA